MMEQEQNKQNKTKYSHDRINETELTVEIDKYWYCEEEKILFFNILFCKWTYPNISNGIINITFQFIVKPLINIILQAPP